MFQWFWRVFQRYHISVSSDMVGYPFAFVAKLLPAESRRTLTIKSKDHLGKDLLWSKSGSTGSPTKLPNAS